MIARFVLLVALLTLTAACGDTGGFGRSGDRVYAPEVARGEESVDGLLVGHRLMAAGEYELALKAYYRAAGKRGMTVDVLSALGSTNLKLGRLGQAERLLRMAVDKDATFVPAWNNLGVVLMERHKYGEAERVFHRAFALDSGESDSIRANLALALAKLENPTYDEQNKSSFALVRRGSGEYLILSDV